MKETLAYDLVKTLFEHKPELLASHSDVKYLSLESQGGGENFGQVKSKGSFKDDGWSFF
jgi:hypothetical protein